MVTMPEHYRLVEELLSEHPEGLVHRVHGKGDSNATADNAHVIVLIEKCHLHLLLGTLHHKWELPAEVLNALLSASGPRSGTSAILNEYVASYQHDWEDVTFTEQDYGERYREPLAAKHTQPGGHQGDDLSYKFFLSFIFEFLRVYRFR